MTTVSPTLSAYKYPLIIAAAVALIYVQSLSFEFVN